MYCWTICSLTFPVVEQKYERVHRDGNLSRRLYSCLSMRLLRPLNAWTIWYGAWRVSACRNR